MKATATISRDRRIAINEIVLLVAFLAETKTPHGRQLAAIALLRVQALAEGGAVPEEADDATIEQMLRLSHLLCDDEEVKVH